MTRVLPEPAPARMSSGPSVARTASRCCSFSCDRNSESTSEVAFNHNLRNLRNRWMHFDRKKQIDAGYRGAYNCGMLQMNQIPNDEQLWQAVLSKDARFDGQFVFAVSSTGIYCRPSCPSRRAQRERVKFFD